MSLLIKALDKAQAEKAQAKKQSTKVRANKSKKPTKKAKQQQPVRKPRNMTADLSLEPVEADHKSEVDSQSTLKSPEQKKTPDRYEQKVVSERVINEPVRAQAANVFNAKRLAPANNTAKIAIGIGALALLLLAAVAYWYQTTMHTSVDVPSRPPVDIAVSQETSPALLPIEEHDIAAEAILADAVDDTVILEPALTNEASTELTNDNNSVLSAETMPEESLTETTVLPTESIQQESVEGGTSIEAAATQPILQAEASPALAQTLTENELVVDVPAVEQVINVAGPSDMHIASESASISISKQKKDSDISPVLMRAYEAYKAGDDAQASNDYKEVLKRYGPNVDAMLGLGAIAARQGRLSDADDWYRKVMELEPRNEIAKAGILNTQPQSQPHGNESSIKSMLATTPDDANLHATLGGLYASKGQWPAAQQAYFDAYRLNQSAENAFNLAVSLDQMAKPDLALPYYQEALTKSDQSNTVDVEAIKARIVSIE